MKKKPIPYREASVAATFFEPAYQRLQLWSNGRFVNLLCFVHESKPALRRLLEQQGAHPSRSYAAKCFAEVWELPRQDQEASVSAINEREWDKQISEALGCLDGNYSAATGALWWADVHDGSGSHRFVSRLLQESQAKRGQRR